MTGRRPEDNIMCQTSEAGERLFSRDDMAMIRTEIGRRILELFGYQQLSDIIFRLRSNPREIGAVLNGETLPSTELLLGIRKITGASIDWILTGEGSKVVPQPIAYDGPRVIHVDDHFRHSEVAASVANQH